MLPFRKVRACRRCDKTYIKPYPWPVKLLIVAAGFGLAVPLALAVESIGLRSKLLEARWQLALAALGGLIVLTVLFKALFQRGVKPPSRQDHVPDKTPAMPASAALIGISPRPAVRKKEEAEEPESDESSAGPAPAAPHRAGPEPAPVGASAADVWTVLRRGVVIPAHPLALDERRRFDDRRMRALTRYYLAAGAGGVAAGVHTTQFAIREHDLLRRVLEAVVGEARRYENHHHRAVVKVAGICGQTEQALAESQIALDLGFDAGLLSLAAMKDATDEQLIEHCRAVARLIPVFGFYLAPQVGGRKLGYRFWRRFCEIENVVAIKIAAFDRYGTLDVMRAVAESGRAWAVNADSDSRPIVVYTGNDDHIIGDLLGTWTFDVNGRAVTQRIVGGLLGHWACWTRAAVDTLNGLKRIGMNGHVPDTALSLDRQVTDMNAAVFDARHDFRGCIPGVHEVLRRQGLLEGTWCLDPAETLSEGQAEEISRVAKAYPHLTDDEFVAQHKDEWLR